MKRRIEKILLISPRYTVHKDDIRRCVSNIGLAYLAAFLEKEDYIVKILDMAAEGYYNVEKTGDFITYGLDFKKVEQEIKEFGPQVVGVSWIFSTQSSNVKELLKFVKTVDKNIITCTGGSHPTFCAEEVSGYPFVDYVVMGEGELPTLQLLEALNNGEQVSKVGGIASKQFINNQLQYVDDVDVFPFPARHLLNMERYFEINMPQNPYCKGNRVTQVITSRGCPAHCIFCTTTNFWGNRYRGRSPQSVVKEIRMLKERYNIDEVQFTDDNITLNKTRIAKILDGIKDLGLKWCVPQGIAVWALDNDLLEKMKESGCYQLTFAIESGNQEVLNKIIRKPLRLSKVKPLVKKAQELGIDVHAFCICGLPGETIWQMYETYDFVLDCGFDSASFYVATPLVGSELLTLCKEKGYLKENFTDTDVLFKVGSITTPAFNYQEIEWLVEFFNKEYSRNDSREKKIRSGKY